MKKFILILLITFITYPAMSQETCYETAFTQVSINKCSKEDTRNAQTQLDSLIKKIEVKYADNPEKLEKFKQAQKDWERFKKSQVDLLYFDHNGSVVSMCSNITLKMFTWDRIKQLRSWLYIEEGDVCGGL